MTSKKTQYRCLGCESLRHEYVWLCTSCGAKDSFVIAEDTAEDKNEKIVVLGRYVPNKLPRIHTGLRPWDHLLNGMVPGYSYIIGGKKGLGKSTGMLQIATLVKVSSLYVTAEEQIESIAQRADRTGALAIEKIDEKIAISHTTTTEDIFDAIERTMPKIVIVDSIQKFVSRRKDLAGRPGSPTQVKYLVDRLREMADERKFVNLFVSQVTKSGRIAGIEGIQHDVDGIFYLKRDRRDSSLLRASSEKNRGGSTDVVTVFRMTELGLVDPALGSERSHSERLFLVDEDEDELEDRSSPKSAKIIEFPSPKISR